MVAPDLSLLPYVLGVGVLLVLLLSGAVYAWADVRAPEVRGRSGLWVTLAFGLLSSSAFFVLMGEWTATPDQHLLLSVSVAPFGAYGGKWLWYWWRNRRGSEGTNVPGAV